jgi:hypothetical protein
MFHVTPVTGALDFVAGAEDLTAIGVHTGGSIEWPESPDDQTGCLVALQSPDAVGLPFRLSITL